MKTSITKTFFLSLLLTSTICLSYSQSDSLHVFEMYCQMGRDAKNQQDLVSALYWYEKAFNYATNKFGDNDILTATSLSFIGELQIQLGDTEKGIQNLHNSVSLCKNYPSLSPRSLSSTIETLANGYANCGNYEAAIQYHNWALEELSKGENSQVYLDPEYDKIAFSIQYCSICYHLALAYRNEQDWQSSLKYYDLIEKIADKKLTKEKTFLLHNSILGYQNKYKQADEFDKDILWALYQSSIKAKTELYMAICQSYINKNDVRNVIRYYNLAIDFALKHRDYAFAELDSNVLKYILNALHNESKKIQYINEFATICKYNRALCSIYADQQDSELIQSASLLYWSIADLYKEHGMLHEGEKYMRERLHLFESAGIVNIDYADAIIGLANWMDIYNQDYIAALEWHKKHVEVVAAICNNRNDPQLQTAIEEMAGCYGARIASIEYGTYVKKDTDYDILPIIKTWKTILVDLYDQLGQNYVDKILEDYSNSILEEYHVKTRDKYWNSSTLVSSIMSEITYYIKKHDLLSADNTIIELRNTMDQYHQEDLYIRACIQIGDIYFNELLLTRAKDIFCEILAYMISIDSQKYSYNIEYCQSQLAKIVGVHLGDTYWAYQILLSRRYIYGPKEIDIEKSYKDIALYIQDQITLCSMEAQKYNFDQALAYILPAYEAFKNHKQNLLDADQMEIIILETMGDIYRSLKDYDKAKNCLNKVLALNEKWVKDMTWEKNTEPFWPNTTYMKLANVYYDMHDYASAKDIFTKVLQYNEKWNPERVMGPASYLMGLCLKEHNYVEAKQYLSYAWNHMQNYIQKQFYTMTSNERTLFWNRAWGTQEMYGGLALSAESFFDAEYYDIVLFCKGLLLRTEQSISDIIEKTDNKNLRETYQKLFDAAKTKDSQRWRYEKDLMYLLSYIDSNIYMKNISWKNIKRKIRKKDVAIEFVECWQRDNKTYAALILRKDWDSPQMISLCSKEELEQISRINFENFKDKNWTKDSFALKDLDKRYFKKGYSLIWSKLEPYINEGDNVYFSPSGLLHQINVELLKDSIGRQANEKYNLYRVSSTRQLCIEKPKVKYTNATLYGGLIYEMDSTQMIAQSRTYHSTDDYVASRGFVADSTMREGWSYLSATKSEVEMIARQMYEHGIRPERYTETVGTEESFKALSGKHVPIIHLATHGFFFKDEEARKRDYFQAFNLEPSRDIEDNSLKRSGLILAGGQRAWLNQPIPANVEDGILLAEEIATMDLSGTDLVVLSACQTGLGEITSEGVFGLQRAFKKAGVQTLIMSLWRVDDNATSLMMQTFYEHLLSGHSKREAFAIAQQAVKEKHPNPYYWAAFIMLD